MMLSVSVVVPTRNRAEQVLRTIRSVLEQANPVADEVIVVDDASTDGTPACVAAVFAGEPRLRILILDRHSGPAIARNRGWRAATGHIVAFTDDDCEPEPGWLAGLTRAMAQADVVQGRTDIAGAERKAPFRRWIEVQDFDYFFETCNIAYRRDLLERLGGFDESFGRSRAGAPNGEDTDLGWRAVEAGASYTFASDAVVQHPMSESSFSACIQAQLRSAPMPYVIARHPRLRNHLTHRVFFQPQHAHAAVSLAGVAVALIARRGWVAGAAAVPYVRFHRRWGRPNGTRAVPVELAGSWLIDSWGVLILLNASIRHRCLVL